MNQIPQGKSVDAHFLSKLSDLEDFEKKDVLMVETKDEKLSIKLTDIDTTSFESETIALFLTCEKEDNIEKRELYF